MLKEMLNELEKLFDGKIENQAKSLFEGVERKTYMPLLKRPKCGMLVFNLLLSKTEFEDYYFFVCVCLQIA
jgi:hypothetical protein